MVIPEKSDSNGKGKVDEPVYTERAVDPLEGAPPPSYFPPASSASTSQSGPLPTNHLLVQRKDSKISGRWTIDTSLQIPSSLLSALPNGVTVRPNLKLESKDGAIDAEVHVIGAAERALIQLDTRDGPITAKITCPPEQKVSIKAVTKDGWIAIVLPRHFEGPISYSTKDGRGVFSPAVQERLTVLNDQKKNGKAYIGDHSLFSKEGGLENWKGDEVEALTKDGDIRFFFEGEPTGPLVKKSSKSS